MTTTPHGTLAERLWPATDNATLRNVLLIVGGSLLLWASAKITVPFWPVPMTMQTFAVLVLGLSLGSRLAAAAALFYLIQGALGLPVFSGTPVKGIGLAYMMGPTGGYLAGFVLAAAVTGWLADRGWSRNIALALLASLIGAALIYAPGLAWLAQFVPADKVLAFGLLPFLAGDLFKVALAALFIVGSHALIQKR